MKTNSAYMENERSIPLHPPLARAVGDRAAIILQQVRFWMINNEQKERWRPEVERIHFKRGRWWVYNTYEEWERANFDFWSRATIERHIRNLEKLGVLLSESFNQPEGDRTKWYTIDFDALDALVAQKEEEREASRQNDVMVTSECGDGHVNLMSSIYIESENTTENKTIAFAPNGGEPPVSEGVTTADGVPLAVEQSVVWSFESRNGYGYVQYVPCLVKKLTTKRVTVEYRVKGGTVLRSVKASKLYATEDAARNRAASLDTLGDLPPLQQVIGRHSFKLQPTQGITARTNTLINMVVSALSAQFMPEDTMPEASELDRAYIWRASTSDAEIPTDGAKVCKLLNQYRAARPKMLGATSVSTAPELDEDLAARADDFMTFDADGHYIGTDKAVA